jgi:hypothetical protein
MDALTALGPDPLEEEGVGAPAAEPGAALAKGLPAAVARVAVTEPLGAVVQVAATERPGSAAQVAATGPLGAVARVDVTGRLGAVMQVAATERAGSVVRVAATGPPAVAVPGPGRPAAGAGPAAERAQAGALLSVALKGPAAEASPPVRASLGARVPPDEAAQLWDRLAPARHRAGLRSRSGRAAPRPFPHPPEPAVELRGDSLGGPLPEAVCLDAHPPDPG